MNKKWLLLITLGLILMLAVPALTGCGRPSTPPASTPPMTTMASIPVTTPVTPAPSGGDHLDGFTASIAPIHVSPSAGSFLSNSENVSSAVLLLDAHAVQGLSDRQYFSPWYPANTVSAGDGILVVSGSIRNEHEQNREIAMYAEGYDEAGKQVAWTLDAAHIAGQIGLHLEQGETKQFTLHLNQADNIISIRIFANNYSVTPP